MYEDLCKHQGRAEWQQLKLKNVPMKNMQRFLPKKHVIEILVQLHEALFEIVQH